MGEALETFRFPFLGAKEDGESFEYLLLDIDQEKANIAIFKWMVNHAHLNVDERIDLFIPNLLSPIYQFRKETSGVVSLVRREENGHAHYYQIVFDRQISPGNTVGKTKEFVRSLPSDLSLLTLLVQLIKDSIILKQGILIYLKHLYPYFSRIVNQSHKDYQSLHFIFDDLNMKIKSNEENLIALHKTLSSCDSQSIPIFINLEHLRENMEPEIIVDLFLCAFGNLDPQKELLTFLRESQYRAHLNPDYYFMNYLVVIKNLEKRLYSNYNQIVLIYLKSI